MYELQAAFLLLQTAWGPRWFVPKRFLPAKYDYHRPVVPREVAEGVLDSSSSPADVETGDGGESIGLHAQQLKHNFMKRARISESKQKVEAKS